jgi:hypothetical protein
MVIRKPRDRHALYVGDVLPKRKAWALPRVLVEADLQDGVRAVPLANHSHLHTRICRAVSLSDEDRERVVGFVVLPEVRRQWSDDPDRSDSYAETYRIRHHSLFAPRDFDISPYFQIIKPTTEDRFAE